MRYAPVYQNRAVSFSKLFRRAVLLVGAVLLLASCRVDAEVKLAVNNDGSGLMTVRIGVDDDALAQEPGLIGEVRTSDLQLAGWQVVGPAKGDRGLTWISISKPFADSAQANQFLKEVTGDAGMLRNAKLTHRAPFGRISSTFTAVVEPSNSMNSFIDSEMLTATEGARPLDAQLKKLEARGKSLDQVFHLTVSVNLPGSDGPAVWKPKVVGAPTKLVADSSEYHYVTLGLGLAALVMFVLCAFLMVSHFLFGWGSRRR